MAIARTRTARPLREADVLRLVEGKSLPLLKEHFDGLYMPLSARMQNGRSGRASETIYAVRFDGSEVVRGSYGKVEVNRDEPLGTLVRCDTRLDSGAFSGATLATSEEAAFHYWLKANGGNAAEAIERVQEMARYLVEDPEGEPVEVMPVFGSKVTLSLYVEDEEDHEGLRERVEALLRREFPGVAIPKILSKQVVNERVTVHSTSGELLASNVLADTAGVYTRGQSSFTTIQIDPRRLLKGPDQI